MERIERKWWTLVAVCTAIFMLLLDITVVNVALPDIQRDLDASFAQLQWVVDAYALTLATTVLAAGSLADLFGRRRVFTIGVVCSLPASFGCGIATDAGVLIAARAVQGVGGGIMFAVSLALLANAFHGRERGTAFGIWGATTGAAVAIGPLVGGILTEWAGWRWIFFVNIPIGAAAIAVTVLRVDESKSPGTARVDWLGTAALTGSLFLLVYGLLQGNEKGWSSPLILGCLVGAAVLLVVFASIELFAIASPCSTSDCFGAAASWGRRSRHLRSQRRSSPPSSISRSTSRTSSAIRHSPPGSGSSPCHWRRSSSRPYRET